MNSLSTAKNIVVGKCFKPLEKYLGLHVTTAHFYSPIPNVTKLDSSVYNKVFDCKGVDWNLDVQFNLLKNIIPKYIREFTPTPNSGLSLVDSFMLYAMVRENKPSIIIEVGGGNSTIIIQEAIEKNKSEGVTCVHHCIEPYPKNYIKKICSSSFSLIDSRLQDVDIDLLSSADLLFIDSSHVSKIDSDVNRLVLEVIPRLKKGCLIHFHDIMFPNDYPKEWVENGNMFWNESYLLHSFMLFNSSFNIVWASRFIQLYHIDLLKDCFSYFKDSHRLSSFWIKKTSGDEE
jgi:predicted O-methyltransferase YrrM